MAVLHICAVVLLVLLLEVMIMLLRMVIMLLGVMTMLLGTMIVVGVVVVIPSRLWLWRRQRWRMSGVRSWHAGRLGRGS